MKVLILPSWYPNKRKFSGSFFKEQAFFLNQYGFDVKILMAEELHTKSFLYQRLKRFFLGQFKPLSKSFLIQDPEAYSFPVILEKGWSEERKYLVLNAAYLKAFEKFQETVWVPELIHVQGVFKAGFEAEIIKKKFGIPYVVIEHSPFKLSAYSEFIQQKIKSSLDDARKVAGVSRFHKKCMERDGIDRNIEVVWNFLDESLFTLKSDKKNQEIFVISTVTTPAKVKDVATFFKAISEFKKSFLDPPKIRVVVVGNNAISNQKINSSYFEHQAQISGVAEHCIFKPYLEREEIIKLMQESDVFVSTSIDEPYGVAIREAMLCGASVISTRSGGPEDTLNSKTGVLVDVGDFNAIARNLNAIYNGTLVFDSEYIRNHVINQSGRNIFLDRMRDFYTIKK